MDFNRVQQALENLNLPEYSGIRAVFGSIFEKRSTLPDPDWVWFTILADRRPPADSINDVCSRYVSLVTEPDARRKCEADLLGPAARASPKTLQNCVGDFYAELAGVTELAELGFSGFKAVNASSTAKAYDYNAQFANQTACIEVKHLRSPRTVLDAFIDEVWRLAAANAEQYQFSLAIDYPSDNTVTADQETEIMVCLASLTGRKPPFMTSLGFADGTVARLTARPGPFTAFGTRAIAIDDPERFSVEGFLNKVREKTERAVGQMANEECVKVLVININSPGAQLALDHLEAAEGVVRASSNGRLRPYFLHYYHFVKLHPTASK
jgi:hypothetical protein